MIKNNQATQRQRHYSNNWSNPCDEQCGCSYVEQYGLEALVSDREFDRKCRQCYSQKHHRNACDESCGCSNNRPSQFISDERFDQICRQMCRKPNRYEMCNQPCGCNYVERYGLEALVSDIEYDRKCRYCNR